MFEGARSVTIKWSSFKIYMPKSPKISAVLKKEHGGEVAISLRGKVVAVAGNSFEAFKKAQKAIPTIDEKEFVVTRIHHKYLAI